MACATHGARAWIRNGARGLPLCTCGKNEGPSRLEEVVAKFQKNREGAFESISSTRRGAAEHHAMMLFEHIFERSSDESFFAD